MLVSANNSAAAIADLVKKTSSDFLLHSPKLAAVTQDARNQLAESGIDVGMHEEVPIPVFHDVKEDEVRDAPRSSLTIEEENQSLLYVLHSSGSTNFPKPLGSTQRAFLTRYARLMPTRSTLSTVPLCHAYGHFNLWGSLSNGKSLYIIPAWVPLTIQNLIKALKGCRPEQFNAVPHTLKLFASSPQASAELAKTKAVLTAGSSCPDEVGDALVDAGVNLINIYGATECAAFMSPARSFSEKYSWRTQAIVDAAKPFVIMDKIDDDLYEPVIKDGWPRKMMSNRPDGSYAMGDLFRPDPECDIGGWIYVGRKDDTLVHVNGEKTNPVPMENKIRTSPWVSDALVFGAGKPQTGALIVLQEGADTQGQDPHKLLWPTIQAANAEAPSHSRLLPEMVRLLPAGTPFVKADKMSLIRRKTVAAHQALIDEIYEAYENGDESSKVILQDSLHARQVVRNLVCDCIETTKITDTQDIFDFGIDSITSERILSALRRNVQLGGRKLSPLFVFENPTIAAMAATLLKGGERDIDQASDMRDMVTKYVSRVKLQDHPGSFLHETRAHTVVLTGATGSLGAHLMHQLCENKFVTKVLCLCRARDDADARRRLDESLSTRGLPSLKALPSHSKAVALASDLARVDLGLSADTFAMMQKEVTAVIHCGWPVNFNMSLRSFETSIQGAVNLINLCVDSCGAFLFCSSVSTVARYPKMEVPEEISTDPAVAIPMGYAQSKWIVENICWEARLKGVETSILRIGQMVYDTQKGIWNEKEAPPMMFKSIEAVHALPDATGQTVNWLPVDKAAEMIVKLLEPDVQLRTMAGVYHITSKVNSPWSTVYEGLREAGMKFDLVPPHEWIEKLQAIAQSPSPRTDHSNDSNGATPTPTAARTDNPVLKLLGHFTKLYGKKEVAAEQLANATEAAANGTTDASDPAKNPAAHVFVQEQVHNPEMESKDPLNYMYTHGLEHNWYHTDPVSVAQVVKMVEAWRKSGFLKSGSVRL